MSHVVQSKYLGFYSKSNEILVKNIKQKSDIKLQICKYQYQNLTKLIKVTSQHNDSSASSTEKEQESFPSQGRKFPNSFFLLGFQGSHLPVHNRPRGKMHQPSQKGHSDWDVLLFPEFLLCKNDMLLKPGSIRR